MSDVPETADGAGRTASLIELRGITKVYGHGEAAVHALRGVERTCKVLRALNVARKPVQTICHA